MMYAGPFGRAPALSAGRTIARTFGLVRVVTAVPEPVIPRA
jgi:hypothetical protein